MLVCKNVDVLCMPYVTSQCNAMLENNTCNVSYIALFFNNQMLSYPVLSLHLRPWSTMECSQPLHGQRTGAFSWRPVLGLSRKTDQFRLDPTQNCAPGWWYDRESSVYHLALEMYSGIFRHATNPLALSRMPTKHQLHPCPNPTHHSHDYHTHTPTVTNPTVFHALLRIILRRLW